MTILDTFKTLFGIKPDKNKLNRALYESFYFDGIVTLPLDNPDSYLRQGYAGNADVYSIIQKIDSMRKRAKLKLYKKLETEENEEVKDHPLVSYLYRVNESMQTDDFISGFLIYRLVTGNTFVYYPKIDAGVNRGRTGAIHIMPSNDVEIVSGGWLNPVKEYMIESSQQKFDKSEIHHSYFFNPLFGTDRTFYGQSPLKAAARILAKQNQAEITELKQFENQGPPYIMYRDATGEQTFNRMTDQQQKELSDKVKEAGSEKKRGLPLILKDKYGIINLGRNLADLDIIESSKDGRVILCNVFGFPPVLLGLDAATYNNMKEARKAAWTDCIIPNLKAVENAFNKMLIEGIDEYKDLYFAYDYSEIDELQEGMEIRVQWMKQAGWSKNEIRQATGRYPIQREIMDEPLFNAGETPANQIEIPGGFEGY
jgi:HK97 family phage portal protein